MNEDSKLSEVMSTLTYLIKGPNILDVGTGFGTGITVLLKDKNHKVTSIDPEAWSFDSIEREFSKEISEDRLILKTSRAENMPFQDNYFNSSLALFSMHHLKDPELGIQEMERVTSGNIVIAEWDKDSAGKFNPHTEEHLSGIKKHIMDYAERNSYESSDYGVWYLVWKSKN